MSRKNKFPANVGDIVETLVPLKRESGKPVTPGTRLRIVAVAPKVVHKPDWVETYPQHYDNHDYFFNALPENESEDRDRIRANFVTIRKV